MSAGSRSTVGLEWVRCDGRDAHVSEFGGLPPGGRPEVSCPECDDALVLKLGEVRAWHAAHKAGALCALSDGESALHHNTKMALARRLREESRLLVEEACIGGEGGLVADDCEGARSREWVSGWTSVAVERSIQSRRPDLVLLDGERVVGAIEVWVSHRVEPDKQALYADWEVDWIEVAATEELIEGETAWAPSAPLPTVRLGPGDGFRCDACIAHAEEIRRRLEAAEAARIQADQERRRRLLEWEREQAELEAELAAAEAAEKEERLVFQSSAFRLLDRVRRDGVAFERVLVFDRFDATGLANRDALVIADVYRGGQKKVSFLGLASDLTILAEVDAERGAEGYLDLRKRADALLEGLRGDGAVVDTPAKWFPLLWLLGDADFMNCWNWGGKDHRWPQRGTAVAEPWRVPWAESGVDCLDLLRFYFTRYLAGLPTRHLWSRKYERWFQPPVMREQDWTLWPVPLRRVERVVRGRRWSR